MSGDSLSFTNRQLSVTLPRWKCSFFLCVPHRARVRGSCWAEFPLPPQTRTSHGGGMVLFQHNRFSENRRQLCTDIVTANLPSKPMLSPRLLHLVAASLPGTACCLLLLYEEVQNWFDFKGSYLKMNRNVKYFVKSEEPGSSLPYPCSLSVLLALNRLESSAWYHARNNLHWPRFMKTLFFICVFTARTGMNCGHRGGIFSLKKFSEVQVVTKTWVKFIPSVTSLKSQKLWPECV